MDLSNEQHCKVIDIPALAVSMSLVLMFFSSRWFSSVILSNVQLMAPEQVPRHKMNWVKMWLGMALQQQMVTAASQFPLSPNSSIVNKNLPVVIPKARTSM